MRGYCWHGYTTTYKTHRQGDAAVQGKKLSMVLYDGIGGGMGGVGRDAQEGGDICTVTIDSHCCAAETNTF